MVSEKTAHSLSLVSGICLCKQVDGTLWSSVLVRLLLELDEAGNQEGVLKVHEILRETWDKLPDRKDPYE